MKTPRFWYHQSSLSAFLAPLSVVYKNLGRRHRARSTPQSLLIPVICIGNIVSGGSGKTPTAIALSKLIQQSKIALSPFFLTRGYRGKIEGPERVDNSHDPVMWGDEALLLSRYAPTIVSKNRYAGGVLAQDLESDLVIMDDGMQNYSITKDVTFCIIDGTMGFGNGKVVPQGPLRQPLKDGFDLTNAFIIIGEDTRSIVTTLPADKPVFRAALRTCAEQKFSIDAPYIAFCGIGYPDKFRASLNETGLNVIDFKSYPDHHDYTAKDLATLTTMAEEKGARLITTEKDFARLPDITQKHIIDVLQVEIVFEQTDAIVDFIKSKIAP